MSQIYDWSNSINNQELNNVVNIVKNGGIIVFPTETVYGIGASALSKDSVEKIYQIKKRPNEKPLSILLYSKDQISKYANITNSIEQKIIQNFMPGPITLILKRKDNSINYVASGKQTIGIRIPNNKIILSILEKLDEPLVAPSANISGKPSGIEINSIMKDFKEDVDVYINGGKCELEQGSTIVEVVNNDIKIIRQGKITLEDIQKVL